MSRRPGGLDFYPQPRVFFTEGQTSGLVVLPPPPPSQKDVWLNMDEGPVTQHAAKHYETSAWLSLDSSPRVRR